MSSGKFQFGNSFNVFVYFKRLFYKRKALGVLVLNYVTFELLQIHIFLSFFFLTLRVDFTHCQAIVSENFPQNSKSISVMNH